MKLKSNAQMCQYFLLKKCLHCIIQKGVPELFPIERNICTGIYAKMAAKIFVRCSAMFYGPIKREQNRNLPQPLQTDHVVYDVRGPAKPYSNQYVLMCHGKYFFEEIPSQFLPFLPLASLQRLDMLSV